ncbi:ABC transporter substrate-binding protein [Phyllobacterium sp. K27]
MVGVSRSRSAGRRLVAQGVHGGKSTNLQQAISRRQVLRGIALVAAHLGATPFARAQTTIVPRIVSLDISLTQIALSVGVAPIGISQPSRYRRFAVEPTLPNGVVDIGGNVTEPSLELLRYLKPDLILLNQSISASSGSVLSTIAPLAVPSRGFSVLGEEPFITAGHEHQLTCEALGRVREGEYFQSKITRLIEDFSVRVKPIAGRPVLVLWGVDRRHTYVLVRNSIFQGVLDRLGLVNAWQGVAMPLGMSLVGLDQIAPLEDSNIVVIGGSGSASDIMASPLWQALRPVRERRVVSLPPMWTVGGLPVAERFARHLVPALEHLETGHG